MSSSQLTASVYTGVPYARAVPLRAILFDLGDTLIRLDPYPADVAPRLSRRLQEAGGIARAAAPALATALLETWQAAHASARIDPAWVEVDEPAVVGQVLRVNGLRLSGHAVDSIADVFGEADVSRFKAIPDRLALLRELRASGLKLGIVSNTSSRGPLLTAYLEQIGIRPFFDVIIYSRETRVRKPHDAIYTAALVALDVAAEEALFVGDRLREDVQGPLRLGMRAALTHEFRQDDPGDVGGFAVIPNLEALLTLIR